MCLAGLAGLAVTAATAVVADRPLLNPGPPDFAGWWRQPLEHAAALRDGVAGSSLGFLVACGGPLVVADLYVFQNSVRFFLLTAAAVGLAGLPLGTQLLLAEPFRGFGPDSARIAFSLAAAVSAAVFWSLQSLVYLDLRRAGGMDGVGLTGGLVPPAAGFARPASVIAGVWGLGWRAMPLVRDPSGRCRPTAGMTTAHPFPMSSMSTATA